MEEIVELIKHVEENANYISQTITGRENIHITMSWAQTMDGIMGDNGPIRISSTAAMEMTHGIRSIHDGIIVGINTVILDNPKLNCRTKLGVVNHPQVIVMDSSGRIPLNSYLIQNSDPIIVYQTLTANIQALESNNIRCWHCPTLETLLDKLYKYGIKSVMVEGGPTVLKSFLPFADLLVITIGKTLHGQGTRIEITLDLTDSTIFNWDNELIIVKKC